MEIICPKCWKREPIETNCIHCGVAGCEACLFPKAYGTELFECADCGGKPLPPEEEPEPVCECERIDVDLVDSRGCEVHGGPITVVRVPYTEPAREEYPF